MKRSFLVLLAALTPVLFLLPGAQGHVPVSSQDPDSLEHAAEIHEPTKSWAIYSALHEGGHPHYYRFHVQEGERIYLMLYRSAAPEHSDFVPSLILFGPGLPSEGTVPAYVEVPDGATWLAVAGEEPAHARYEGFAPSSMVVLATISMDAPATGTYHAVVHEPNRGGNYGMAVGSRESFTLGEWILTPLSLIAVYEWEGQGLPLIFAPMAAVLAIGLGRMAWRRESRWSPRTLFEGVGAVAGLLFLGSGATVLFQLGFTLTRAPASAEILITLVLAAIPLAMGFAALRLSLKEGAPVDTGRRIRMAILGVLALFAWAGLLLGPVLALVASVLPPKALGVRLRWPTEASQ